MADLTTNPFNDKAFEQLTLTDMVNNFVFLPQQLAADGVFDEIPVPTWDIAFDILEETLTRLGTKRPGTAPNVASMAKAVLKKMSTYHIPYVDSVTPLDIQGVRLAGTNSLATLLAVIAQKQAHAVKMMDLTAEWFRMGAIQGKICEPGDNDTTLADAEVLLSLETEFGKSVQTLDFVTETSTTDIRGKCIEALRAMESKLGGRPMTGAVAYMEAAAFDALVGHAEVKEAFKYTQSMVPSADLRKGFAFGGITFKEYRQRYIGESPEYIPANQGYIVPVGSGIFKSFYGPALYFDQVNSPGAKYYSKIVPALDNASAELQVQSNPLIINTNPDTVILGTFTTPV